MAADTKPIITSALFGALAGAMVTIIMLRSPVFITKLSQQAVSPSSPSQGQSFSPADSHEAAVTTAVQAARPAVVSIVISKDVPVLEQYFESAPNVSPFGGLFGQNLSPFQFQVPRLRQNGTEKKEVGGGSGFLVSADGYIVTNKHVVSQQNAEYTVFSNDGKKYDAKVAAIDPANDIAVLKIEASGLPFLQFGDSDKIEVGQTVIAIGNALGEFRNTVSVGVISGLSRSITAGNELGQAEQLDQVIQTDAAINPGNSGGPLLDLRGRVLGVNVAVALGSQSVGFALPANTVSSAVDTVKSGGRISRPYLGVRYIPVTPALKTSNKLTVDYGALVVRGQTAQDLAVIPGSAANKAGIVEGDIILEFDGVKLDDTASLSSMINKKKVGDTVSLKILHQGDEKMVAVKLAELPN